MIMVIGSQDISAYATLGKATGYSCGEAHRLKRRMHLRRYTSYGMAGRREVLLGCEGSIMVSNNACKSSTPVQDAMLPTE